MILTHRNKWMKARFVFRHRWEGSDQRWESFRMKNNYELGVWLKTYRAVGKAKGPVSFVFSDGNSVRGWMFGVNLVVCKFWLDLSGPVMELSVEGGKAK